MGCIATARGHFHSYLGDTLHKTADWSQMSQKVPKAASRRHMNTAASSANLMTGVDEDDDTKPRRAQHRSVCSRLRQSIVFVFPFCIAMFYIAGDLVFSDAAFKASEVSSLLVPYIGLSTVNPAESSAEALTYCDNPYFGHESIYWQENEQRPGNTSVGGNSAGCTIGSASSPMRSVQVDQSGYSSSVFFRTLSVKDTSSVPVPTARRFYALHPEMQSIGFTVLSERVSDGKMAPPTALYLASSGAIVTTSKNGYGWASLTELFKAAGLAGNQLDIRREENATGPTFRESGLSIEVTITFRNYPLSFDEIDPWLEG